VARFRDRVAIVTGAGAPGGIGAAVARELVAEGARVVLGATSERVHQRAADNPTTKLLAEGLTALTEALRELDAKLEKVDQHMRVE
jgi:NAD(P)-dependent dehydrogenase (short-subunit alcohol dehydrogenase family)